MLLKYFNSIVVRLKHTNLTVDAEGHVSFNSIVVRLKQQRCDNAIAKALLFQFYSSSIKTKFEFIIKDSNYGISIL